MALNLSGTSGITGAGIGTIDASGSNVTGVVTCTSVVSSGAVSGTTGTFTGDVSIADKIIHTGDTNTAIRFPAADTITAETGGTERFRITSSGQLQATGAADVRLTLGSSGTAGTNDSVHIRADSASLNFMAASGGVTKFEVNGTETLRISSNGDVKIKSFGDSSNASADALQVGKTDNNYGITILSATDAQGRIDFTDVEDTNDPQGKIAYYHDNNSLRFFTNGNTERVRIPDATWGFLVTNLGSTGNTGGYQTEGVSLRYSGDSTFVRTDSPAVTITRKGNAGKVLDFYSGTNYAGGVHVDGQNSAQYQSSSDYRLKDNVNTMSDGISKVKQLNPIYYTNKQIGGVTDTTTVYTGFLAHEVESVIPTLVDGEKDGDIDERGKGYQTLSYGRFSPTVVAAMKELIAKVETLEAEVAALKSS